MRTGSDLCSHRNGAADSQQAGAWYFLTDLPSIISGTTSINGTPVPLSESQYIIPFIKNAARPDGDVLHEVQYGQSLWSIVITDGTTIKQIQAWNNLGTDTTVYEQQMLLVQKRATQPVSTPTQTATIVFANFSSPTPSPTSTHAMISTSMVAPPTSHSSSIVVVLIIGVSVLIAGVGAGLRSKITSSS